MYMVGCIINQSTPDTKQGRLSAETDFIGCKMQNNGESDPIQMDVFSPLTLSQFVEEKTMWKHD